MVKIRPGTPSVQKAGRKLNDLGLNNYSRSFFRIFWVVFTKTKCGFRYETNVLLSGMDQVLLDLMVGL